MKWMDKMNVKNEWMKWTYKWMNEMRKWNEWGYKRLMKIDKKIHHHADNENDKLM